MARTYKLKLEVFEDGKNVLNLHVDETALKKDAVTKIIDAIFDTQKATFDQGEDDRA